MKTHDMILQIKSYYKIQNANMHIFIQILSLNINDIIQKKKNLLYTYLSLYINIYLNVVNNV